MKNKTLLFAALVCLLGWCCVSCESNDPSKSNTYVAKGFSVSASKQVIFSPGNLQYTKSTNTWSFAAQQYEMIGEANINGNELADKIDLFGWSGNKGAAKWGISTSENYGDYAGDFADWGLNIDDGSTWRSLTHAEWSYLLHSRTNAASLVGVARINLDKNGTTYANGLILLPDHWTNPDGIIFKSGISSEYSDLNLKKEYANYQTFTKEQWTKLEAAGAVFLPASGFRGEAEIKNVQELGVYWSATPNDSSYSYRISFFSVMVICDRGDLIFGQAVRLVKDL